MLLDGNLQFVPVTAPLAIVSTVRSLVIDLLGVGAGVAPPSIIGNTTLFGSDIGLGDQDRLMEVLVGTAFTTGSAATLQIQQSAAPDTGSAGGYQPGAWTVLGETDAFAVGSLTAGAILARFPILPAVPAGLNPRFLSLNFVVGTGTFTAGTIAWAGITLGRDDTAQLFQPSNYVV